MQYRGSSFLRIMIISLASAGVLLLCFYFFTSSRLNKNISEEMDAASDKFLVYISKGDHQSAGELWPSVYTVGKDDAKFLESFSFTLELLYKEYYKNEYLLQNHSAGQYETARIYNDFIKHDAFNRAADVIYSDYINEVVTYETFTLALTDLIMFDRYESSYASGLLENADVIHSARASYAEGIEAAKDGDYRTAIDLLKKIQPMDPFYYPRAVELIDEYIMFLKDKIRDGS